MESCFCGRQRRRAIPRRRGIPGTQWGTRGRRRRTLWSQREQEQPWVELPEAAPTDKHVGPAAGVACLHGLQTNGRVLAGNQTHPLQLLEEVASLEYPLPPDVHPPVSLGLSTEGRGPRGRSIQVQVRLGLMEIPPQGSPKHQRNLARGRGDRLVVTGRRVDDIRDIEAVAAQGGGCEAGGAIVVTARRVLILASGSASLLGGFLGRLLAVDDDGPTRRKSGVVDVVVGLEGDPTKHRRHGEREAVGQVAAGVSHGDRSCAGI